MATKEKKQLDPADFTIRVYQKKDGERRAGMWTFSVNGMESEYYAQNRDGLNRTINAVLQGPRAVDPKRVHVNVPLKGKAKSMLDAKATTEAANKSWAEIEDHDERLKAFMNRGRLKDGVLQPSTDEGK